MPLSGDILAKAVAKNQPVKLAALEGQFETTRGAPLRIGGFPDEEKGETNYAIEIPYLLSVLGARRPERGSQRLERFSERHSSASRHRPFRVSDDGRLRDADDGDCGLERVALLARATRQIENVVRLDVVSTHPRRCRAAWFYCDRNRLDGHRSRASAVDYLRHNANCGRGNADAGSRRAVRNFYGFVYFSRDYYGVAFDSTGRGKPERTTELKANQNGGETCRLKLIIAGIMLAVAHFLRPARRRGLRRRRVGFVRFRRARQAAARTHRRRHRSGLGSQSCLADSRHRYPFYRFSARVRGDFRRAAHSAHAACSSVSSCAARRLRFALTMRKKTTCNAAGVWFFPSPASSRRFFWESRSAQSLPARSALKTAL